MLNKKGFELTISTLILIVLGVIVLVALVIALTGGLDRLNTSTEPFLDTAEGVGIRAACKEACNLENKLVYCCETYDFKDETISCQDSRLDIDCTLECETNFCKGNQQE
jgi:hypothetical protein